MGTTHVRDPRLLVGLTEHWMRHAAALLAGSA